MKTTAVILTLVAGLCFFMWVVDFITLEGEWTIYTVQCQGGKWLEDRCTGTLQASDRHRFRALKLKGEVLFWTVGSKLPSGKLAPCVIQSRSEWTCEAGPDSSKSITREIKKGRAVPQSTTEEPFHAVAKWNWYLIRFGLQH